MAYADCGHAEVLQVLENYTAAMPVLRNRLKTAWKQDEIVLGYICSEISSNLRIGKAFARCRHDESRIRESVNSPPLTDRQDVKIVLGSLLYNLQLSMPASLDSQRNFRMHAVKFHLDAMFSFRPPGLSTSHGRCSSWGPNAKSQIVYTFEPSETRTRLLT